MISIRLTMEPQRELHKEGINMDTNILIKLIESERDADQVVSSYEQGWDAALEWVCNLLTSIEEAKL